MFECEEINGHGRCPTYLYRWILFVCRWFGVYLHHFVGDDTKTRRKVASISRRHGCGHSRQSTSTASASGNIVRAGLW